MSTWNFAVVLMVIIASNTVSLGMSTFPALIDPVSCYVLCLIFTRWKIKVRTGNINLIKIEPG